MWKRTNKWRPGRVNTASGGFGVQCGETQQLGYAKPREVWQEKLAHELAKQLGVPVPEIRLGEVEGAAGLHAISVAFGKESIDLRTIREGAGIPAELKGALAGASGLLAFHAWLGTGDLKDDHVLVSAEDGGAFRVAAIDFASAFTFPAGGGTLDGSSTEPKGLVENVDKNAVEVTVQRIVALTDEEIRKITAAIPENVLPPPERDRVAAGLISRRGSIRAAMKNRGWLP